MTTSAPTARPGTSALRRAGAGSMSWALAVEAGPFAPATLRPDSVSDERGPEPVVDRAAYDPVGIVP